MTSILIVLWNKIKVGIKYCCSLFAGNIDTPKGDLYSYSLIHENWKVR